MENSRELTINKDFPDCPIKKALSIIGGKWKIYIIWILLQNDSVRYSQFKKNINGINDMMLSQCLKELEEDRVISRIQYNEIPIRVEYSLTANGKKLSSVMEQLSLWGRLQ